MAQTVKNLPAMRETWAPFLGWENPLEEGRATHYSILAWRIPMDRGAWQATGHGVAKSRTRPEQLSTTAQKYTTNQFSSVAQLCLTLCDAMNRSTPGLPVHHQLPEFTQTHVH